MPALSSPFVGLTPFNEASQRYFCARDKEVALIVANATASRLTVFYGPSGAGKSSIVGAGLIALAFAAFMYVALNITGE